jgi:GNAT superfamily N-acetyltransferase
MSSHIPKIAKTDNEIQQCFDVMSELRSHLTEGTFLQTIRHMESEGYRLAYIQYDDKVVSVAGYRIYNNLFMGKHLYIDDLVTANTGRSKGYGEQLLQWLRDIAVSEGCQFFHLDSGTHRGRAHKFYFEQGLTIASYHFSEKLKS